MLAAARGMLLPKGAVPQYRKSALVFRESKSVRLLEEGMGWAGFHGHLEPASSSGNS
jgi:hypothetical protein